MTTTMEVTDYSVWGPEAHGVRLHVNAQARLTCTRPWIIDVENNQDGTCAGIGVTNDDEDIFYFTEIKDKNFFADAALVGHNIKYDIQKLRQWGFNVSPDQILWDTQVAEYVRNSTTNSYGLKDLSLQRYGAKYPSYEELCGKGTKAVSIGSLPVDLVANYNGCDVLYTFRLFKDQVASFQPYEVQYMEEIELPTLRVLLEMEERGVCIDKSYIQDLDQKYQTQLETLKARIETEAGKPVNLNSHQQIKALLLDKYKLRLANAQADTLEKYKSHATVGDILKYKQITKLKNTYTANILESLDPQSRLHGRFNQTVTDTGRLSSSDPNLQNIPTEIEDGLDIRKGFIAPEGKKLARLDYSQIELRVLAHKCEDPLLMEAFKTGEDIHKFTSRQISASRDIGKTINFAIVYGSGAYNLSEKTGISLQAAQGFMALFEDKFYGIYRWKAEVLKKVHDVGYAETLFGRRIPWFLTKNCKKHKLKKDNNVLPCGKECDKRRYAEADRRSISAIVQGTAAEVMKLALIATRQYTPVLTVHDEIVFELDKNADVTEIKTIMEQVVNLKVPLLVEAKAGTNWSESKNG